MWRLLNKLKNSQPGPVVSSPGNTRPTEQPSRVLSASVYSPKEWASLKKNEASMNSRWFALQMLGASLGFEDTSNKDALNDFLLGVLPGIISGEKDPFRMGHVMNEYMTGKSYASYSIKYSLAKVRAWFQICGVPIEDDIWNAKVDPPKAHREKEKGLLNEAGVKALLHDSVSTLEHQALYEVLALSGARIREALNLKVSDIDIEKVPGIPLLFFRKSKTDNPRESPISKEAYRLIMRLIGPAPSPDALLFPNIEYRKFYDFIQNQLVRLGLTKKKEWIRGGKEAWTVGIHNFRQFAEDFMLDHGLNVDESKWLVGRKNQAGSRAAYMTIERLAPLWKEKMEPFTNWLEQGPVAETPKTKEPDKVLPHPIRLVGPMILQASKPQDPAPSNVPHEERVGPEKVPEPVYPLKPAPPVDSGPSVKASLPAQPIGPHAMPYDSSSYRCSECQDVNGYQKETIEKHIRRIHMPDKNKLEGWT